MILYTKEMSPIKDYYRQYSGLDKECQCYQCGDLFQSRGWALYCSLRCKNDAAIQRRRYRYNFLKTPPPPKKCVVCDKSFDSRRNDKKYCGNACKQKQYRTGKGSVSSPKPITVTAPTVTHTVKQRKPNNTMAPIAWQLRLSVDSIYKGLYIIEWADAETLQMFNDNKISIHKACKKAKSNEWKKVLEVIRLVDSRDN